MTAIFNTPEGELQDILITQYELIDRHVGSRLWAWGSNAYGQLGDNSVAHRSSPVQTVAGGITWADVALGKNHSTAGIKLDGTLWLWGRNSNGVLGDNTTTNRSSPVQTVAGGTDWVRTASGILSSTYSFAGIKTDGTLWMWGLNNYGKLGDNTTTSRSSPVQTIAGGTTWSQVSAGFAHTMGLKSDGTLWTWGFNNYGSLGDNTTTARSSPVQTVTGGTTWRSISAGAGDHSSATKTDGTLWMWGNPAYGELGNNSDTTNRSSPIQTLTMGSNWRSVSSGQNNASGIKTDGTLWMWGKNNQGQLGDNTITNRSSPVQTVAGGTNWKQIAMGSEHTAAVKTDGTLWTWGRNHLGQLGDNTITTRSSPVQTVAGGTNWKKVSVGLFHTVAVTFDGG